MAVSPGKYALGPDAGYVHLRTTREGLAARIGHDLLIAVSTWSGELTIGPDSAPAILDLRMDLGSLAVLEATSGDSTLSQSDRGVIARNAQKVLGRGVATFSSAAPLSLQEGGRLQGMLSLRGRSRPVVVTVERRTPHIWLGTTTIRQTDFGITPYSTFFGALRVSDSIAIEAELVLPEA